MSKSNRNMLRGVPSPATKAGWIVTTVGVALLGLVKLGNTAPLMIRAGYPQLNGGQAPLWVIFETHLDRQYGVDFKPVYIPGGARLTQTIISGDFDLAITGGAAVNAMLSGADMIYIGMPVPTFAFSLYAGGDIKAVPDLRGKVLGVITKGASSDHASITLLRQHKMS